MTLQEAMAMFPPDGAPLQILDIDAYRSAELRIEAAAVLAAYMRLMQQQTLETFRVCRRIIAGAHASAEGGYALVNLSDVDALAQHVRATWGPGVRHEINPEATPCSD
jgi:hypothetical protein